MPRRRAPTNGTFSLFLLFPISFSFNFTKAAPLLGRIDEYLSFVFLFLFFNHNSKEEVASCNVLISIIPLTADLMYSFFYSLFFFYFLLFYVYHTIFLHGMQALAGIEKMAFSLVFPSRVE